MRYAIRHVTRYAYARPAAFSQHLLRLTLRETETQRVIGSAIEIAPRSDLAPARDLFGNLEHVATVARAHDALEIVATARVERLPAEPFIVEAGMAWEAVRERALGAGRARRPTMEAAPFAFPSAMTAADAAIEDYAARSLAPGRSYLAAARELCARIHADFTYVPGSTAADTDPQASFAARRGVCQDFAHVMLACLRAHRLPARYVSGYLRTLPPPGRPRLEGADASHAWVAVWDPVLGWVDLDPTNDMVPDADHVTLAWGRDYRDVSPVSGLVVGSGAQSLSVGVDVVPLAAEEA